jgi:hypothetical protein
VTFVFLLDHLDSPSEDFRERFTVPRGFSASCALPVY